MSTTKQIFILAALLAIMTAPVFARPITKADAEDAVQGWINMQNEPLDSSLGKSIDYTESHCDGNSVCLYYVVYLKPSGYVIVAADDLVEPIVAFVTGYAYFDPSQENVLGAMVSRDLPKRVEGAVKLQSIIDSGQEQSITQKEVIVKNRALQARQKWSQLHNATATLATKINTGISDIRVAPLVASKWGQDYVGETYCYNYYTPNHYYDGCVATAMAQCMRFWQWPTASIGVKSFTILVGGVSQTASTRGGDGLGGAYNWSQMPLVPSYNMINVQRQAIGALCYDAGVAAHMQYSSTGSGAYMHDAKAAMVNTFKYTNAVMGGNEWSNIGTSLKDMINSNLDAGNPVMLGIWKSPGGAGHAIIADGYGYNSSTMYTHLNLGWDGQEDAWYNLPNVDTAYYQFNVVDSCIYNIFTSGNGEIISGRITQADGTPYAGATVTAEGTGGPYTAVSNSNGIYALMKVQSNTTYTVSVTTSDCNFIDRTVTTGLSADGQNTTGNKSGIDFVSDSNNTTIAPVAPGAITYPATSGNGIYTVSWNGVSGATTYELRRSGDNGSSWQQIALGAATAYSERVTSGGYRYSVRAMNGGGTSRWTTGGANCVVTIITQVPGVPASITYPATSATGKYAVSWAATSNTTTYQLERTKDNGITWQLVYSSSGTSYSENVGTSNCRYRVKARNAAGRSAARTGTSYCVVKIIPNAPATISYVLTSSTGKYTVLWTAASLATGYQLERSNNGGLTWIKVYSGTMISFAENVGTGNYRYRVKAIGTGGSSAYRTGSVNCLVRIPPKSPTSLKYPTSSTGRHTVSWVASVGGAKTYQLQRSRDGGLTWVTIYNSTSTYFAYTSAPGQYRYRVRAYSTGGYSAWVPGVVQCTVVAP